MKKRLLLCLMAVCTAISGFALSKGEYVYTPSGRFLITDGNINTNSAFTDFSGWTAVSATAGKTTADLFTQISDGYAAGINSVQSLDATETEGMYYKFTPGSNGVYVVSFKMKGAALTSIRIKTNALKTNLVRVKANSGEDFGADSLDYVCYNTAEEVGEEWQTFNYAVVGDGVARTCYISFTGIDASIEIADVQIAPAAQVADLRQRDAMVAKINAYKNCYQWDESLIADYGLTGIIASLEAISDNSTQADLDNLLVEARDVLDGFISENMDDYLAGDSKNYFLNWASKLQKGSSYGIWSGLPAGRLFWENNGTPFDLGHFQSAATWSNGSPTSPMGVFTSKDLDPGSYVFAIEAGGVVRENLKNSWDNDDGLKPAYGVVYVVKMVDGVAGDTIVVDTKDVSNFFSVYDEEGQPRKYLGLTPFIVTAQIAEAGTYEFGCKIYCKEAYQSLTRGSAAYVYNASIWGKNDNKYSQKQLGYEADVREQITVGRENLTKAADYLANADYYWAKAALKDSVDTYAPVIEQYEAMSQDDIIDTYEDDYVKSTSEDTGYMVYEVYQNATRWLIAANKYFEAVNDTLNSLQTAIANAEKTLTLRIYDAATGKADFQAAIATAKGTQTTLRVTDYTVENAAAVLAAISTLNDAVDVFKASVPASAITDVVDIDFTNDAVLNEETQFYSITGAAGAMEFSNFAADATDAYAFQQGIWSNGEQLYKNYIRVGNGTGTVNFNTGDMGTDILKVNCDFYLQGLVGRYVGFFLDAPTDTTDVTVASFYANYYDNVIDATSTLPIALGSLKYGSGSTYANLPPEGAEGATGNTLPKNSFEVILDFGEGSIYATTTSANGVVTTEKQGFNRAVPNKFILKSNYVNNDRRTWFSNLKIQRIKAGPTEDWVETGINAVAVKKADNAVYSLTGVKMNGNLKPGLYIVNGKKFVIK